MSLKSAIERLNSAVNALPPMGMQGNNTNIACPPPLSCYTQDSTGWYHHTAQYRVVDGKCVLRNQSVVKIKGNPPSDAVMCNS
jgi:hypothetical protein